MYEAVLKAVSNIYAIGLAVVWLLVWVTAATGFTAVIASRLLAAFGDRRDTGFDFWLASMLGGIALTIWASIGFMAWGGLTKWRAYTLILVMLVIGTRRIPKLFKYVLSLWQVYIREVRANPIFGITVSLILLYPLVDLLMASLVAVRCGDILVYHIREPLQGRYYMREVSFGGFYAHLPRNVETIYFWLRLISGDWAAPNLFQALLFFTAMAGLARFFYHALGKPILSCLLACIVMMSMVWFYAFARVLYIDSTVNSLIIITTLILIHWLKDPENRAAVLAGGLAAGLAIGSKYVSPYYVVTLGGTVFIFYLLGHWREPGLLFKSAGIFVAACLLAGSYWYIRNWYALGNPVYPFLFGHEGFTDAQMQELAQRIKVFAPKYGLLFFIFPWFDQVGLRATNSMLIPFYFTLGAFVFKRFRRDAILLAVFLVGVLFLVQGHSSLYPRYQSAFFILAAVLGVSFLGALAVTRFKWLNRLVLIGLVVIGIVQIFSFAHPTRDELWAEKAFAPVAKNIIGKLDPKDIYCEEVWGAIAIKNLKGAKDFRIVSYRVSNLFLFFLGPLKTDRADVGAIEKAKSMSDYAKSHGYTHLVLEDIDSFSVFCAIRQDLDSFRRHFEFRQKIVDDGTLVPLGIPAGSVELYKLNTEGNN